MIRIPLLALVASLLLVVASTAGAQITTGFPNEVDRCQTEPGPFKGCPSPPGDAPKNETVTVPTSSSTPVPSVRRRGW
jgi:hypothetical protein